MRKLTKEERAKAFVKKAAYAPMHWSEHAIEQQDAREGPLVDVLRSIACSSQCDSPHCICKACRARKVLAAYDALDAAPEPTLLEAAKAAVNKLGDTGQWCRITSSAFHELKAAVERAEREGK